MLKRVVSDEKGRVLVWTLVILGVGALLIPPLLARVNTNFLASQTIEQGLKEQYAADSGVEYALLQIQEGITTCQSPTPYAMNGKGVEVTWGEYITGTYKITSTATSPVGSSTIIESYITLGMFDYLWLLDNAITSLGDVDLAPGTFVSGTIEYGGALDNKGVIEPEEPAGPQEDLDENWPPPENMADYYFGQVEGLTPYPSDSIDLKDVGGSLGPLYRIGDLSIDNTGAVVTVVLGGTIYVAGDLDFDEPGVSCAYTIDLNGQTIYVEKDIYFAPHRVTITGSGCIIAEGFINFQPAIGSDPDDFVFVMSINDYVWMKPNGDFYGSVAGDAYVDLQPGGSLVWKPPPDGLNFPDGTTGRARIHTYKVYP